MNLKELNSKTVHEKVFSNPQIFDLKRLKGELTSYSYIPNVNSSKFMTMMSEIEDLFDRYNDNGKVHYLDKLPGFVVIDNGNINGLITYQIDNMECEIVLLDSMLENQGIGNLLLKYGIMQAKEKSCARVWLITTNDNTKAIRFYQKRGFDMKTLHYNAIKESRKIKPEIPLYGYDNIPILHEIEFDMKFHVIKFV